MKSGQLRVIGGGANLQVDVRGTSIDLIISADRKGWEWTARGTYTDELCAGDEKTWAAAYRKALRAANGMAPFRKHEKPKKGRAA